jgi:hypothetical protein
MLVVILGSRTFGGFAGDMDVVGGVIKIIAYFIHGSRATNRSGKHNNQQIKHVAPLENHETPLDSYAGMIARRDTAMIPAWATRHINGAAIIIGTRPGVESGRTTTQQELE